jgi:hypothetical protein
MSLDRRARLILRTPASSNILPCSVCQIQNEECLRDLNYELKYTVTHEM